MKMNNPFDTYSRGMTARERRIRSKYGLLFAITGVICIWLAFTHYTQKREIDSLGSDIKKYESLQLLLEEVQITSNANGRYEIGIEDYIDDSSHVQMQETGFVSKFSREERIKKVERIKQIKGENDYPLCAWIIAFELFRKEDPEGAEEIEKFVGHLTE
jgi:hypothetical protein